MTMTVEEDHPSPSPDRGQEKKEATPEMKEGAPLDSKDQIPSQEGVLTTQNMEMLDVQETTPTSLHTFTIPSIALFCRSIFPA